jgi:hypothetical protein
MIQQYHSQVSIQRNVSQVKINTHVYFSIIHNSQAMETPRCPTTDEWIKKMWYVYNVYYSAIKKNEILLFTGKCIELENIMLSEVSQIQKNKGHMFSRIYEKSKYKYKHYHTHVYVYIHIHVYIFLLHAEREYTWICIFSCVYFYIQREREREKENMFPKVGLLEKTKGGGKEERNDSV